MKRSFEKTSMFDPESPAASNNNNHHSQAQIQIDEIGMDEDRKPNEYQVALKKVSLVERNPEPGGYQMLNTRQVGRHTSNDIIELAHEISMADAAIRHTASGKLTLILEQIKFLQAQAKKVLEETKTNRQLHSAACNFRKVPLKIYHMYRRPSGQSYMSMMSPEEWGLSLPHEFQGSFRLEHDQSWTPVDRLAEVTKTNLWAQRLLAATDDATAATSFLSIED